MTGWAYHLVPLPDGRQLEVLDHGTGDRAMLWFTGTPGAAVPDADTEKLAARHGLRVLQPLRPGYGQSDPRPGRRVVDLVEDVEAVLHALGIEQVVCTGGSGGGPHTLAMAARLPQCRAAAALVSPAPRDAEGLDFYDGMALSNQEEWHLADQGEDAVRPWLEKTVAAAHESRDEEVLLAGFADCYSPADRALQTPDRADHRARAFGKATERGIEGWLEDDLALTTPWGFDLGEIAVPLSLWTGKQDWFVSWRHSAWLAERLPTADLHVRAAEGHFGARMLHMDEVVEDVLHKAGLA